MAKEFKSEKTYLWLLTAWGLIRGLVYLAVIPPWQHYDEPAHFERLYWLTESLFPSASTEKALSLPAEISASMCAFRFWPDGLCSPPPDSYPSSLTLFELAAKEQPLYYYLGVPLQLVSRNMPVEFQLYLGRLVSVALYVLTLLLAYAMLRDLAPDKPEFRLVVPTLMACIPAYTDVTSAVNNDVGAIFIFSLLLWGALRLIRNGWSLLTLIWVIGSAVLALFTKRTAAVGILVALIAILLSWSRFKWWGWVIGGVAILSLICPALSWTASASWYELDVSGNQAVRVRADGPVGEHATCARDGRYLVQELPYSSSEALQGQIVTLGGWVRTDLVSPTVSAMILSADIAAYTRTVTVTSEWSFAALTATVEPDVSFLQVHLLSPGNSTTVCYDGVVLAQGEYALNESPQFADSRGDRGTWAGHPFVNLLVNGSFERSWPRFKSWAYKLALNSGLTRDLDPTIYLHSIIDWRRTGWIYRDVWLNIWESFWAAFSWNSLALPDMAYQILFATTWLGIGGVLLFGMRRLAHAHRFSSWQKRSAVLFALSVILVWGSALLWYSHPILSGLPRIYYAVARYTYPVIIPVMLALYIGWRELVPRQLRRFLPSILLLGIVCLDMFSLMGTILPFYYLA